MDLRVINTSYAEAPIKLFVAVTNLCLEIDPEDGPPGVPYLVEGTNGRTIGQTWGECPHSGGVGVYYSLAEDGETVQFWDCEEQGYDLEELGPPDLQFPLSQFKEKMLAWAKGDI